MKFSSINLNEPGIELPPRFVIEETIVYRTNGNCEDFAQMLYDRLRVVGRCRCGCPSIDLTLDCSHLVVDDVSPTIAGRRRTLFRGH